MQRKARSQRKKNAKALVAGNLLANMGPGFALLNAPVPPQRRVLFKYCDTISLTSSSLTVRTTGNQYEFKINSCYDPDFTSTGHQPYMWDQFAALYGRYRVDAVDVQIDVIPSPSTSHCVCVLAQGPSGGWSLDGRPMASLVENTKVRNVVALANAVKEHTLRFHVDIEELIGIPKGALAMNLNEYSSLTSNTPSRACYLNLATSCYAGTSETIQVMVTLVQHVTLWDPIVFGQS